MVITKLNDELLKKIATQSSGKYIKGDNGLVVDEIINELKEMDKKEFESKQFVSLKINFTCFGCWITIIFS